ncbi:MAG: hypothetical protein WCE81_03640 [Halobacteriota archaeon]
MKTKFSMLNLFILFYYQWEKGIPFVIKRSFGDALGRHRKWNIKP